MTMIKVTSVSLFLLANIMIIGALTHYDLPWTEECSSGKTIRIFVYLQIIYAICIGDVNGVL